MGKKKEDKTLFGEFFQEICDNFPFLRREFCYSLSNLKILLDGWDTKWVVVGSIAFVANGMKINRKIEDIDLEVVCNEEQEEIFKNLAESQGVVDFHNKETNKFTNNKHKPYVFNFLGVIVNVFVSKDKLSHPVILERGGIPIPTLDTLIESKMQFHRPKDLQDLLAISQWLMAKIVGEENLEKFINKINIKEIEQVILEDKNNE